MKAVVFQGVGEIRLEEVPEPKILDSTDAIVRLTGSAICGTDLHLIRGTVPGMKPGTILGHEGIGVVEEVGPDVRNLKEGDRVVIPSTICCGNCVYCRSGYTSQCDRANPHGPAAGTAFYGGPELSGPFHGLQAELARIPMAHANLIKLPEEISDDEAITLSDIFPTAYFGAILAEIKPGNTVAVFGCGPVGQLAIASAKLLGAGRIFAIDTIPSRLLAAKNQGAEIVDFNVEHPVEAIHRLTSGIGVDRAIDAVGVDANRPHHGPAALDAKKKDRQFKLELDHVAPKTHPHKGNWHPGDAPSQALRWAVGALAKAGTLSIIGVYPQELMVFPIGKAMGKNLTLKMGNCDHRRWIPELLEWVRTGAIDPSKVITQDTSLLSAIEAYEAFDRREHGWIKVKLEPLRARRAA
jgi:threonine dehydrogenase-like Zn-dependent dehydrogenase